MTTTSTMWALDARLDSVGIRHHIGWFDGVHAWPGAADLAEAVEWMHLQAMRRGLLAADRPDRCAVPQPPPATPR
ncbi:MAG: hypothetical protein IPF77_16890 [Gemmatimonadetes bacterium]|nr:hypothetical protein [Gemmatimonadota bacterium]